MRLAAAALLAALALAPAAAAQGGSLAFARGARIFRYDPAAGTMRVAARGAGAVRELALAPDGARLAFADRTGVSVVGGDGRTVRVASGSTFPRWIGQNELLVVRGSLAQRELWGLDLRRGTRRVVARGFDGPAFLVAGVPLVSRDGDVYLGARRLTSTTADPEVVLDWDADLGALVANLLVQPHLAVLQLGGGSHVAVRGLVRDAAWSPDGTQVAYVTARGALRIRTLADGRERLVARGVTALDW